MKNLQTIIENKFLIKKNIDKPNEELLKVGRYTIAKYYWDDNHETYCILTKPFKKKGKTYEIEFEYWSEEKQCHYMLFTLDNKGEIIDSDDIQWDDPILTDKEADEFKKIFNEKS